MAIRGILLILIGIHLATLESLAKVGTVELADLVVRSDLILVARVEAVITPATGGRYANARVDEVWKGPQMKAVEFNASPTFWCDTSNAVEGETILLFLKRDVSGALAIMHSGRGRIQIRTLDGKSYATFGGEVIVPKEMAMKQVRNMNGVLIGLVELTTLHNFVGNRQSK